MNKFDSTDDLVGAVRDIAKLRASVNTLHVNGVLIRVDSFTENHIAHVRDVGLPVGVTRKLIDGISASLHDALVARQRVLRDEVKTIENCLATYYSSVDE